MTDFAYSNVNPRRSGRFLRVASRVLPGVGRVQAQAVPYAEAWRESNLRALDDGGPLWVALGDSLSQGVGASAYDRGWVGQLAERLRTPGNAQTPAVNGRDDGGNGAEDDGANSGREDGRNGGTTSGRNRGRNSGPNDGDDGRDDGGDDGGDGVPYRLVNLSMTGARVDDVVELQLPALESLPVVPDLITVLVGSNDVFRRAGRPGLADRYEQLLRRLPATTVLVGTLPNPSTIARALNQVTLTVAAERGFTVADTRRDPRTQFWAGKLAADRFHPNDRGYAAIAAVFADAYVAMSTKRE